MRAPSAGSLLTALLGSISVLCVPSQAQPAVAAKPTIDAIDDAVRKNMSIGKIPGMSLVVLQGGQVVYQKGYGTTTPAAGTSTTSQVLFQLGSTSKAFTGLGTLLCRQRGLLTLNAAVTDYLPWLVLNYQGKPVKVTVNDFLHHTSGVPESTLYTIPEGTGPEMLEKTVRAIAGTELASAPGTQFAYTSMNYDVLGLIIQKVTGAPFTTFATKELLGPLGLRDTTVFKREAIARGLSDGFKIEFLRPAAYVAPAYEGNLPAGYFISNGIDVGRWLRIHLGAEDVPDYFKPLLAESVHPYSSDDPSYAAGWFISKSTGMIYHGGNNPNYSSYFLFSPSTKMGVGILANVNSNSTTAAAQDVAKILTDQQPTFPTQDPTRTMDSVSTIAIAVEILLAVVLILSLARLRRQMRTLRVTPLGIAVAAALLVAVFGVAYILIRFPQLFLFGSNWPFMAVWGPVTLRIAAVSCMAVVLMAYVDITARVLFPRKP